MRSGRSFSRSCLRAAVGQQEDQQADGFVMAVVQADADQVNPWAVQRQHHFCRSAACSKPRLVTTLSALTIAATTAGSAGSGVRGPEYRTLQRLGGAVDDQPVRLHAVAVLFAQVNQPRLGLADFHGFEQHPLQQRGETGFGAQAVGDPEEARQGVFHARHRHAQLVDFQHR